MEKNILWRQYKTLYHLKDTLGRMRVLFMHLPANIRIAFSFVDGDMFEE